MMNPTRRQFMRLAASYGLGGGAAMLLERFALTSALAQTQTDYKALVCVFLGGGNDANNLIVPISGAAGLGSADATGGYPAYLAERGNAALANGTGGLAFRPPGSSPAGSLTLQPQLLQISAGAANPNLGPFGMHPSLGTNFSSVNGAVTLSVPSLKLRYDEGRVAVVCNVGTLRQALSKAQYQGSPGLRPSQLFSHSDQVFQNETCVFTTAYPPGVPGGTGWGGRTTDLTKPLFDGSATFPSQVSITGARPFMTGLSNFPLVIATAPAALNSVLVLNGFGTTSDEVARRTAFNNINNFPPPGGPTPENNKLVGAARDVLHSSLAASAALGATPLLRTADETNPATVVNDLMFPNTTLGNQLRQVARLIKANLTQPALALKRQIFFCTVGGSFDLHANQNTNHDNLLLQLNQALATFHYWLRNNVPGTGEPTLGDLTPKVTCFTLSDFSRTFNPAGLGTTAVGTDHGWGSHFMAMGGAVQGGRFYGVPLPGGNGTVFPTLGRGTNNAYDTDNGNVPPGSSGGPRGRWIPSVSTIQYANTLAAWFGLPQDASTLDYVFPLLRTNFAQTNLGFV